MKLPLIASFVAGAAFTGLMSSLDHGAEFVFLVTDYTVTPPTVYAMDTSMSGNDCIARMAEYKATVDAMGWQGSCEFDMAGDFE